MTEQLRAAITAHEVALLHRILAAVERNARVKWERADDIDVRTGTLRRFNYPTASMDLGDATIRITTSSGTELDMPVIEAMDLLANGAMAFEGMPR